MAPVSGRAGLACISPFLRVVTPGLLGGGTPAFMRLGNHAEAEQAASSSAASRSSCCPSSPPPSAGTQTFTRSDTDGYSEGDSSSPAGRNSTSASAAGLAAPRPPGPGPPVRPGPTAPAGAMLSAPSGSTNTPSSQPSCRTSPTALSCDLWPGWTAAPVRRRRARHRRSPRRQPSAARTARPTRRDDAGGHQPDHLPGQHQPAGSPRPPGRSRCRDRVGGRAATALDGAVELSRVSRGSCCGMLPGC